MPDGTCVKAVDRADILRDVKAINPNIFTILRHWDDSLQHYDGNTDRAVLEARARHWFSTHIDSTFRDQYADVVDAVSWHNEIWANSQNAAEVNERIAATWAAVNVWNDEYRPTFGRDIRLVIGEAAVGNDMPAEIAQTAIESDNIVGYHPYSLWVNGVRDPGDFQYISGRYNTMEQAWGLRPTWAFTEAGPFSSVLDGWRSGKVLGNNIPAYVEAVRQWIYDLQTTDAYLEGRILGFNLFTSGGSSEWKLFETRQPEMDALADMIYDEWNRVIPPPKPPDPPTPPPDDVPYKVIVNLLPQDATLDEKHYVVDAVHEERETILQSADDAARLVAPGRPGSTVKAWGAERWPTDITTWLFERGVNRVDLYEFEPEPELVIHDIVNDLTKHATLKYTTRKLTDISTITIHHTVSNTTPEVIARYHVGTRGWPGIGYHFIVMGDGTIYQVNYLETKSYHAGTDAPGDENLYSVGVALMGDFTNAPPPEAQLVAAANLVAYLKDMLGVDIVKGHKDMPGAETQCPGNTSPQWFNVVAG